MSHFGLPVRYIWRSILKGGGGSTNTMGLLEIGFDVCAEGTEADGYPRSRSAKVELDYTANP